ncbi:MAG TPA: hypothetical protein VEJ20_04235, partial [Candidatus Eremiobacteraceae bacterium]|nr:hypothetical protein [Candidatus Eremiobacteraceae bacterium]
GSIPASPTTVALGAGQFSYPGAVAVDGSDNVFVADTGDQAVKEIVAAGGYSTVNTLGSGFTGPDGIAVDGSGNVYVADGTVIKEILAVDGSIPPTPTINTLATGFKLPQGLAVDGAGNVYVADVNLGTVSEILAVNGSIPASPTIITLGSGFSQPAGVAIQSPSIPNAYRRHRLHG